MALGTLVTGDVRCEWCGKYLNYHTGRTGVGKVMRAASATQHHFCGEECRAAWEAQKAEKEALKAEKDALEAEEHERLRKEREAKAAEDVEKSKIYRSYELPEDAKELKSFFNDKIPEYKLVSKNASDTGNKEAKKALKNLIEKAVLKYERLASPEDFNEVQKEWKHIKFMQILPAIIGASIGAAFLIYLIIFLILEG